eukprot:7996557-Pyramimonas_sp.AAC.1
MLKDLQLVSSLRELRYRSKHTLVRNCCSWGRVHHVVAKVVLGHAVQSHCAEIITDFSAARSWQAQHVGRARRRVNHPHQKLPRAVRISWNPCDLRARKIDGSTMGP